jgi:hypothetical protein
MTTVRSRTTATSNTPLQFLVSSSSQSGAQIAAPQPATVQVPVVAHPSIPSNTQGTPQKTTSQSTAPPASQLATPQTQQIAGCSSTSSITGPSPTTSPTPSPASGSTPSPGSPPTVSVAPSLSQAGLTPIVKSRWEKLTERVNSLSNWTNIVIALILAVITFVLAKKAWSLQVWSALNDQRDSCWTDRDHGMNSRECNETLAHPATPPPFKRGEVPQKRGELEYLNLSVSFICVIITIIPLVPKFRKKAAPPLFRGETRALHRQIACEATWTDYYYSWTNTTPPFLRRTRLFWTLKVSVVLLNVLSGFLFLCFSGYSIFLLWLFSLAFLAVLYI